MSEIRYDRLHDLHVIIAPERLRHPDEVESLEKIVPEPYPSEPCPFCEGNEALTPREIYALRDEGSIINESGWQTRVVPNLFKAVQIETPPNHHFGLFEYREGFGAHEVIIDTPRHTTSMCEWGVQDAIMWFTTLAQRVGDLRRDHRITHISLFKNEGKNAGSSMSHCHTQLIALPLVPKSHSELYRRAYEYYQGNAHPLMESIVSQEEQMQSRIIEKAGGFTSFCPYASGYPFEVMISSAYERGHIDTLKAEQIETISTLLVSTLQKLKRQLGVFHFNLSVSTPPLIDYAGEDLSELCRFTIRIMPRLYRHGGFENTSGILINPVTPELAAKLLRESNHE
ncbi:UTP--glucose-1-phosphate uridylyltransferase [Sulfuricurvum sp.]|uniref:galactose-1-phosphate uridylyltransferase n=1 Tax=Sulfuricurvum sp. TaxID=2025608 RepID=UPI002E3778B7|nr:UTP--glucose-1-phosphate uridylyltransferase [Sulfuricurvum sp.]HEX5329445.1 UTP--glucose-1-phosphate uridylyltransferase [Sulfuricurvum sp.]